VNVTLQGQHSQIRDHFFHSEGVCFPGNSPRNKYAGSDFCLSCRTGSTAEKQSLLGITASTFSGLPFSFSLATRGVWIIVLNDSDLFLSETVEVAAWGFSMRKETVLFECGAPWEIILGENASWAAILRLKGRVPVTHIFMSSSQDSRKISGY
jgi:hypothetical protein